MGYSIHLAGLNLIFHCSDLVFFKGAFLMKQKGINVHSQIYAGCKVNWFSNIQRKQIH